MKTNITQRAAVRLAIEFPFWSELFFGFDVVETDGSDGVTTLATDGRTLWINTAFYNSKPMDVQTMALIHETLHKALLHNTRRVARDPRLWNVACDHAVNNIMVDNNMKIPGTWLCDRKFAGMTAETIYATLKDDPDADNMQPDFEDVQDPGLNPEARDRQEEDIKQAVESALSNARAMGKTPAGMEQEVGKIYRSAREPWHSHLARYMQGMKNGEYDWSRLNRRTIRTHGFFSPMFGSRSLGPVVIFMDTSGSCFSAAEQAGFVKHINAIMAETKPEKVKLYYFDSRIYDGPESDPGAFNLDGVKPRGGGGTDFRNLFDRAVEDGYDPAVAIVLTDMYGPFPSDAPPFPVVWADVVGAVKPPFGEHIVIEQT